MSGRTAPGLRRATSCNDCKKEAAINVQRASISTEGWGGWVGGGGSADNCGGEW